MSEKLVWLLNEIEMAEEDERKEDILVITVESMRRDEDKKNKLVKNNEFYYRSLHQSLSELSTFYSTYMIAGILNEEQIELLKELTWDIHDILLYEPDIGVDDGTILYLKRICLRKCASIFQFLVLGKTMRCMYIIKMFLKNSFKKSFE